MQNQLHKKMKNIYKIFLAVFIFCGNILISAQGAPPPPTGVPRGVPTTGVGGTNPESAAAPIDMYVYILAIAALLFIALYAKKILKRQTV